MKIVPGDFSDPQVVELLRAHVADLSGKSPACAVYALDLSGLQSADISFYVAWAADEVIGMGALKQLDATTGEIKSMRTRADRVRKGVGRAMLEHLLAEARLRGYRRVSLETGTGPAFEPALALYRRHGFVDGEAFGSYAASVHNRFMHLEL